MKSKNISILDLGCGSEESGIVLNPFYDSDEEYDEYESEEEYEDEDEDEDNTYDDFKRDIYDKIPKSVETLILSGKYALKLCDDDTNESIFDSEMDEKSAIWFLFTNLCELIV